MKTVKLMPFAFVSLVLALFSVNSHAAAVGCSFGSGFECVVNAGDSLPGGLTVPNSGNDKEMYVEAAIELVTGNPIDLMLLGKDGDPGLTATSGDGGYSGTWNSASDLVGWITVKAANSFIIFEVTPGSMSGIWDTLGILNKGGQQPTLSHISFWKGPEVIENVSETGSLAIILFGLGGLLVARRRRTI